MKHPQSDRARRTALARLLPGEALHWSAIPKFGLVGVIFRWAGVLVWVGWTLFALLWTGLAFLFTTFRADESSHVLFRFIPLVGVPFILIGVIGFVGSVRGVFDRLRAVYALTDRRLLIIEGKRMREFGPQELKTMEVIGNFERGDIGFAHSAIEQGAKPTVFLQGLAAPHEVEALIRSTLLSRR